MDVEFIDVVECYCVHPLAVGLKDIGDVSDVDSFAFVDAGVSGCRWRCASTSCDCCRIGRMCFL